MTGRPELISAWWKYQRMFHGNRQERLASDDWYWAWEEVDSAMSGNYEDAIDLLERLAESAESPSDVGSVGAGPLYSSIYFNLGALKDPKGDLVRQLDEASRRSAYFRTALGDVWYHSEEIPTDVRNRIAGFPPPMDERFPTR